MRIGVGGVTGGRPNTRSTCSKTNGIDLETKVQYVIIGQGAARVAGVRTGQADVFVGSGPETELAEHEEFGELFMYLADVPVFRNSIWITLAGKKDWIEVISKVSRRVCRAIARGGNLFVNDRPPASTRQGARELEVRRLPERQDVRGDVEEGW